MVDRAFMAGLWKSIRSAVHEFKISRMQRRSDKRFCVVEVSKCERRRFSYSGGRPPLSARCIQLKRSVRKRVGQAAAAVVACPTVTKNTNAGWGLISSRRTEDHDNENYTEEDIVTDESAPINWTRRKEIEIGEFSPQFEIATISSWKSMEEIGSWRWEDNFLTTSASSKSVDIPGESRSAARATSFESRRWENRYRVSDRSPQLLQPVRGKLTTLSSLLRTISDRYARRTGKLTPLNNKSTNNNTNNERLVYTQSLSAAPWPMQAQQQEKKYRRSNSTSEIVYDVPVKRYDNPFQGFLRQSFAERHSMSVHETDRQR